MNITKSSKYEIMFLVDQDLNEEEILALQKEIKESLKVQECVFKDLGIKRLAYKIQDKLNGRYFTANLTTEKVNIKNFLANLKWNKKIIRHLVINLDNEKHFRFSKREEIKRDFRPKRKFS